MTDAAAHVQADSLENSAVLADEEKAHAFLSQFFLHGSSFPELHNPQVGELAMKALRRFPKLASQKFRGFSRGINCHPFVHLIYCDAGMEFIQEVYHMYEEAARLPLVSPSLHQVLHLTVACCCDNPSLELIRWLAEIFPSALTECIPASQNSTDLHARAQLPIHALLNMVIQPARDTMLNRIIVLLYELSPKSLSVPDSAGTYVLSTAAIHPWLTRSTLQLVAEAHWTNCNAYEFSVRIAIDKLHHEHGVLENLLSHLKIVTVHDTAGDFEKWKTFLQLMCRNTSVTTIVLQLTPGDYDLDQQFGKVLAKFCCENNTINNLEILFYPLRDSCTDLCFHDVAMAIADKTNVERLVWKEKNMYNNPISDNAMVTLFSGLPKLHFHNIRALQAWPVQDAPMAHSRMKTFSIKNSVISSGWLFGLLDCVSRMPLLESFELLNLGITEVGAENDDVLLRPDITNAVIHLVNQGILRKWESSAVKMDIYRVLRECLKENTSLSSFLCECWGPDGGPSDGNRSDIGSSDGMRLAAAETIISLLEERNTTLTKINIGYTFSSVEQEKILYLTQLNRYGRGDARKPDLPMASFVKILSAPLKEVPDLPPSSSRDHPRTELASTDVSVIHDESERNLNEREIAFTAVLGYQYGLLKQCPSLWSENTSFIRKRKRTLV